MFLKGQAVAIAAVQVYCAEDLPPYRAISFALRCHDGCIADKALKLGEGSEPDAKPD